MSRELNCPLSIAAKKGYDHAWNMWKYIVPSALPLSIAMENNQNRRCAPLEHAEIDRNSQKDDNAELRI